MLGDCFRLTSYPDCRVVNRVCRWRHSWYSQTLNVYIILLKGILYDVQFRYILQYLLVNDSWSITIFEFDSEINGILQLGDNLDYETTTEYAFNIAIQDTGGQNDTATVDIKATTIKNIFK